MKGDLHNFGKQTSRVIRDGVSYFAKPRTVFWERFFFGLDSPLKKFFDDRVELKKNFSSFFTLRFEIDRDSKNAFIGSGSVLEVARANYEKFLRDSDLKKVNFQYGVLCAYCYAFGLSDMNVENVLVADDFRIQPIDIENAFLTPKFLSETALLSTGGEYLNRGCFSLIMKALGPDRISGLGSILDGFNEGLVSLQNERSALNEFLVLSLPTLKEIPARTILKSTVIYYAWLIRHKFVNPRPEEIDSVVRELLDNFENFDSSFIPEEILQLQRGEIPYFFTLMDREELFYVTTPEGDFQPATSSEARALQGQFSRPKFELDWRLSGERLIESALPSGIMEILWDFLPKDFLGVISTAMHEVAVGSEFIRVEDVRNGFVYVGDRVEEAKSVEDYLQARLGVMRMPLER